MRASTIFASAATLVSAVSAGAIPTFAKRYNVTEAWGSWDITNITVTAHNSNSGVDFQVWWDQGNSGPVRCSASGYSIDADKWYRCEVREGHADSFNFNLNQGWTSKSLSFPKQPLFDTDSLRLQSCPSPRTSTRLAPLPTSTAALPSTSSGATAAPAPRAPLRTSPSPFSPSPPLCPTAPPPAPSTLRKKVRYLDAWKRKGVKEKP